MRLMLTWSWTATLTVIALGCANVGDRSQPDGTDLTIGSEVSCASCTIAIESLLTLEHAVLSPWSTSIDRDSTGNIYLLDRTDRVVKAYSSNGRFLGTIGRRGAGPGEYEMVQNLHASSDGWIHVLDGVLGRHSVFRPNGEFDSSSHVDITPALGRPVVFRSDGQLVMNGQSALAAGTMNTVHLVDETGRIVRSAEPASLNPGRHWLHTRLLWLRANGELLVARPYSLKIGVYSSELAKERSITRVADWFPSTEPETEPSDGVFDEPFTPRVMAMWEDGQGLLWVVMAVPSPTWTPRPRRRLQGLSSGTAYLDLASRPRLVTIIEAIDPAHLTVVARSRFDGPVGAAFGGGYLAQSAEDSVGDPVVRILRLQLKR